MAKILQLGTLPAEHTGITQHFSHAIEMLWPRWLKGRRQNRVMRAILSRSGRPCVNKRAYAPQQVDFVLSIGEQAGSGSKSMMISSLSPVQSVILPTAKAGNFDRMFIKNSLRCISVACITATERFHLWIILHHFA